MESRKTHLHKLGAMALVNTKLHLDSHIRAVLYGTRMSPLLL